MLYNTSTETSNNDMRLSFLLFLLLLPWLVSATSVSAHFERLSVTEGMSQSSTFATLQDAQGFMWFATEDGLNRYDGYQFIHYRHDSDDPSSLSSSYITALFEDAEKNLWVGTIDTGLNRFDAKQQRFERFAHDPDDPTSLSSNRVTTISQDHQGTLWVGSSNGLSARKLGQASFKQYKHNPLDPHSLSHDNISNVFTDSKGVVWVSTLGGGINRFDASTGNFEHFSPTPPNQNPRPEDFVFTSFEDAQGKLWSGSVKGLSYFNTATEQFVDVKLSIPITQGRPGIGVFNIGQDPKGNLWIATNEGGVHQFNPKTTQLTHYHYQNTDSNSLSGDIVLSIDTDSKGLLWIGTQGAGVNKLNTRRLRFGHVKHNPHDPTSLNYDNLTSFSQDAQGNLWIGTSHRGVNKKEQKLNSHNPGFETLENDPNDPFSLSNNVVNAVSQGANGTMWVGTVNGLNHYNPLDGRFTRYSYDPSQPESLNNNFIIHLLYDSKGTLWVATRFGLYRFKPESKTFEALLHDPSNSNSLSDNSIMRVFEDNKGFFWIATINGLNQYDPKNKRFIRYHHDKNDPTSLSHNGVISIAQDDGGTLWVGTNSGLNKFDSQAQNFKQYRAKDGLPNDVVYAVLPDNQGNLWLSTNAGLSKFNPKTQIFKNFDVNDGLQNNEFNANAAFKSSSGELFFGGINGYNHFYPNTITDDTLPPKVVLTEFLLFNQSVPVMNPTEASKQKARFTLPQSIGTLKDLTLDHKHNLLTFEFAALDFSNPMKNSYAYKLDGQDQNWITASAKNRRATYTNLAAGDYTLRVKAANPDGYWNEQGTSINIHINPAPWLSWWAYTLYSLLASVMMYGVYHYQIARLRLRNEQRKIQSERSVHQRLKQVDKLKDSFLANTSHELRTPLNGIIGLAESLVDGIAGPLPDKANKNLNMVVTSGKRLANLVNDILDLSKLKHASMVLNTRNVDIHALADVVLTLSKPLVGDKDLTLVNAVPTELPVVEADEDRLLQIMHNLVGNAIKFTDNGSVRINAFVMDEHIKISITDSGIGIEADKFATIFNAFEQVQDDAQQAYGGTGLGLSITRQLVSLHGGTIDVRSVTGEGSVFTFSLPLGPHQHQTTSPAQELELAELPMVPTPKHVMEPSTSNNTFEPSLDGSKFRLLLVDDEPINLQVLNNHLSLHNYQLVEANDGLQALDALEHNGPFDLVLLDIMMPKLSGYEVCKKIRQTHSVSELPVIFLTAQNQVDNLIQGFSIGGNDHLTKPVDKHELLARVETHLKLHDINRNLEDKVEQRTHEILATQKKLILSEKLASLGTLMAGVAHEINNPTNFVSVCVHTLESDLADCRAFIYQLAGADAEQSVLDSFAAQFDPLEKHLSMLKDGSERIKTIVKDLKTSTHMNDEDKTTATITDIIQTTVNLIGAKYKQQIQLLTDFIDHPVISCYPAKLNQVFMNLIVNACDALLLDEGKNESTKQVIIRCRLKGSWVEITVKDNGCGMDESTKSQLFEPFFTTKGIDEGTGLGLSISYDIVQKHGGDLTVESTLDIGTEFTLMLPV